MNRTEHRQRREAWIKKYTGHFGEPVKLHQYRAKEITFEELYRDCIRFAEMMVAEVQSIHSDVLYEPGHPTP